MSVMGGVSLAQVGTMQVAERTGPAGRWMTTNHASNTPAAADTLYLYWMPQISDYAITLLRTRTTTGGAGSAIKFALWRHDATTGRPRGLPVIGQNAGLATTGSNTWQDLVVAGQRMGSPGGIWFGSVVTGTLPTMIINQSGLSGAFAMAWPAGSMPVAPRGNFSIAQPYANDIMALDLTGAALIETSAAVPAFAMEWA